MGRSPFSACFVDAVYHSCEWDMRKLSKCRLSHRSARAALAAHEADVDKLAALEREKSDLLDKLQKMKEVRSSLRIIFSAQCDQESTLCWSDEAATNSSSRSRTSCIGRSKPKRKRCASSSPPQLLGEDERGICFRTAV